MTRRRPSIRIRRAIGAMLHACALVVLAEAAAVPPAQAAASSASARAGAMTQALVTASSRYSTATSTERRQLEQTMLTTALARRHLLVSLMSEDPGTVLRVSLSNRVRSTLPPSVRPYVEEHTNIEGEVEVLHEDSPGGGTYRYFVDSTTGRYSLHFANRRPANLLTGARIRARGVRLDRVLALDGGDTSAVQTVSPGPVPNALGEQRTVVILVNFQDAPTQPYGVADVQHLVFGTTSDFFVESSYRQTWVTGDVYGWYTIPVDSTTCDQRAIATQAKAAALAAGVDLTAYRHHVYAFPENACGWSGAATVGGNPSQAWLRGPLSQRVVGHELGHNLGLEHSHALVCADGTSIGSNCTRLEYGDGLDIMGWSESAHFNAYQKERLGWLNNGASPPITTVVTSGQYLIDGFELPGTKPKALKILKSTNPSTGYSDWYYVELRQGLGFDGIIQTDPRLDSTNILSGVVVHIGSEDNGGNSNGLLDMTPETYELYSRDPALTIGRLFSDPAAGITVSPLSVGSAGALVAVTVNQSLCDRAAHTVVASPSTGAAVSSGTAATFTITVTNNDGPGCPASDFNLAALTPTGWVAVFASSSVRVSPRTSSSTTLTITSPPAAAAGGYTVQITATDLAGNHTGATSAVTYVVASGMALSLAADKIMYARGQTVTLTAKAMAAGSSVSNASVTFVIVRSDGTALNQSGTTDGRGVATMKFRLKRPDPAGTYRARADIVKSPLSGSVATTFTVE